jgi:hypothetical protein
MTSGIPGEQGVADTGDAQRDVQRLGPDSPRFASAHREQLRRPWALIEVEVADQVPQPTGVLPHGRARVGSMVSPRVQALAVQEVILDELRERVEAELLVVDVATSRIGLITIPGTRKP